MDISKHVLASEQGVAEYEKLLELSHQMLEWSREGDWQALFESEVKYVTAVGQFARHNPDNDEMEDSFIDHDLGLTLTRKKTHIIKQLVEQSREIRLNLITRRDEIGVLIKSSQQRHKLNDTYGAVDSGMDNFVQANSGH